MNPPSLATIRDARASGTLVPAANKVKPMTVSGMPIVSPKTKANLYQYMYREKYWIVIDILLQSRVSHAPTTHTIHTMM